MIHLPCPPGRGPDVLDWLIDAGIEPRDPAPVRPSEAEDFAACPFYYLLRHRFGINTPWSGGNALELGRCFHAHIESVLSGVAPAVIHHQHVTELRKDLEDQLLDEPVVQGSLDKFEESWNTSQAWAAPAWERWPLPPHYRVLATELFLQTPLQLPGSLPTVGQCRLDALLYDESRNELWPFDIKTCSQPPLARLSTCPWEFQTNLNHLISHRCLPAIIDHWHLPSDASLAGFIHYAVRKPSFKILAANSKTGPPGLDGYRSRCREWYAAEGEFLRLSPEWSAAPPVNISYVRFPPHPPLSCPEFSNRLHSAMIAATRAAIPANFPRSSSFIRDSWSVDAEGLHRMAPFYADDSFERWPDLLSSGRFIRRFRDSGVPADVPIPPFPFNKGLLP